MKLQMKRDALARLSRKANEPQLSPGFDTVPKSAIGFDTVAYLKAGLDRGRERQLVDF